MDSVSELEDKRASLPAIVSYWGVALSLVVAPTMGSASSKGDHCLEKSRAAAQKDLVLSSGSREGAPIFGLHLLPLSEYSAVSTSLKRVGGGDVPVRSDDTYSKGTDSTQGTPEMNGTPPHLRVYRVDAGADDHGGKAAPTSCTGTSTRMSLASLARGVRGGVVGHGHSSSATSRLDADQSQNDERLSNHQPHYHTSGFPLLPPKRHPPNRLLRVENQIASSSHRGSRRSKPIKCQRKPRSQNDEDFEYLRRQYDMRTWDMYLRIIESRKKEPSSTVAGTSTSGSTQKLSSDTRIRSSSHRSPSGTTTATERPSHESSSSSLQHNSNLSEEMEHSVSESQELIFGDLEE